jgi:hypothetical protein
VRLCDIISVATERQEKREREREREIFKNSYIDFVLCVIEGSLSSLSSFGFEERERERF